MQFVVKFFKFKAYTVPIRLDSPLFKWLAASGSWLADGFIVCNTDLVEAPRERPVRDWDNSSSKRGSKSYISRSGRPTWRPYRKGTAACATVPFLIRRGVVFRGLGLILPVSCWVQSAGPGCRPG